MVITQLLDSQLLAELPLGLGLKNFFTNFVQVRIVILEEDVPENITKSN